MLIQIFNVQLFFQQLPIPAHFHLISFSPAPFLQLFPNYRSAHARAGHAVQL